MLVEKEIIAPGTYWYTDQATGLPRKLDVTPELTKYWHDQGGEMLRAGLTIPVPYEHDFSAHPMTPKDKLLNNAGWTKEYRLKDNKLFGVLDVQDEEIARKLPLTIRWTSPWINSFTDGAGKQWNNVISHIALTTRPRITKQAPFGSIAAALSIATHVSKDTPIPTGGYCLSRAGRLGTRKADKRLAPRFPIAFSLFSGAALGDGDMPPKKKGPPKPAGDSGSSGDGGGDSSGKDKSKKPPTDSSSGGGEEEDAFESEDGDTPGGGGDGSPPGTEGGGELEPFSSPAGDVGMEELLCDLLGALGIHCEKTGNEETFKRALYVGAMTKIHELTSKAQTPDMPSMPPAGGQPGQPPGGAGGTNPLIQQEQQPMFMSIEEINKITDPTMRTIALSMYNENAKLRGEMEASTKTANSLRDAKLREATTTRQGRVQLLSRLSPRVKADLEGMLAAPSMALSMGDGGTVIDPMEQTLAVLEKGLSDMPRLLTADMASLSVQPQPTDAEMSTEDEDKLADSMARMMGCPPQAKQAS